MIRSIVSGHEQNRVEGFEPINPASIPPEAGPDAAEEQAVATPAGEGLGTLGSGSPVASRHEPSVHDGGNPKPAFTANAESMTGQDPPSVPSVRQVAIQAIRVPKGRWPINRKWLPGLMRSIEYDGLLTPITVRESRTKGQAYELVSGWHRLEACRQLGWSEVMARVVDLDDALAEVAAAAENIWCLRLEKRQLERYLAKWEAFHKGRFPETTQHRAGGFAKARKSKQAAAQQTAGAAVEGRTTEVAGSAGGDSCFAQVVADRTGKTRRTAERALKRSRVFCDEDYDVFEQYGVLAVHRDALAAIVDAEQRAKCIGEIGQGLDPAAVLARHQAAHGSAAYDASFVVVDDPSRGRSVSGSR